MLQGNRDKGKRMASVTTDDFRPPIREDPPHTTNLLIKDGWRDVETTHSHHKCVMLSCKALELNYRLL